MRLFLDDGTRKQFQRVTATGATITDAWRRRMPWLRTFPGPFSGLRGRRRRRAKSARPAPRRAGCLPDDISCGAPRRFPVLVLAAKAPGTCSRHRTPFFRRQSLKRLDLPPVVQEELHPLNTAQMVSSVGEGRDADGERVLRILALHSSGSP